MLRNWCCDIDEDINDVKMEKNPQKASSLQRKNERLPLMGYTRNKHMFS